MACDFCGVVDGGKGGGGGGGAEGKGLENGKWSQFSGVIDFGG